VAVDIADLERRARELLAPGTYDYFAGGSGASARRAVFLGRPVLWAPACGGATGVRDLLTGMTGDLAHVMALAGARSVAGIPEVTGPPTGNSLDT
jgi:isopentenyl diphosphate isomerase/L-lactate dehydrogenase-like FMN-dependent dehydrogenase